MPTPRSWTSLAVYRLPSTVGRRPSAVRQLGNGRPGQLRTDDFERRFPGLLGSILNATPASTASTPSELDLAADARSPGAAFGQLQAANSTGEVTFITTATCHIRRAGLVFSSANRYRGVIFMKRARAHMMARAGVIVASPRMLGPAEEE